MHNRHSILLLGRSLGFPVILGMDGVIVEFSDGAIGEKSREGSFQ